MTVISPSFNRNCRGIFCEKDINLGGNTNDFVPLSSEDKGTFFVFKIKGVSRVDIETFIQVHYQSRKQTNSLKWDALKERYQDDTLLPLWVADTEFSVPQTVQQALSERIAHGIFGYSIVPETYFSAYAGWQARHEQTAFQAEWLEFTTGVVQALYDLIACFTQEKDQILIQTPVYYPFFNAIKDQNRELICSPLKATAEGYQMDLENFEQLLKANEMKLFILCSPHNPVGRVWTKEELTAVLKLCHQYHVRVIADEIHSDLILSDHHFVSAVTVAQELDILEEVIVCNAPSKTFNLATLLNAHIWLPGERTHQHYRYWCQAHRQTEYSSLGQLAALTAYQTGDEWLAGFLQVVETNYQTVKQRLAEAIPEIGVADLQGSYLLWLDLRGWISEDQVKEYIQEKAGLAIDFGEWFSPETKGFIRINLGTHPATIDLAIDRLIAVNQQAFKEETINVL